MRGMRKMGGTINNKKETNWQDLSQRSRSHKLALNMARTASSSSSSFNLENLEDIIRLRQGQLGCRLRVTQHAISLDGLEAREIRISTIILGPNTERKSLLVVSSLT